LRFVRLGAIAYLVGVVQFLLAAILSIIYYGPPSYNLQRDSISDLQAVKCGIFQGNQVCSPLHLVANLSVTILGLLLILGSLLIRPTFPAGRGRSVALALLVLAGLGTAANGFTPEDVTLTGDALTAFFAFLCANLGLIQLGRVTARDAQLRGQGAYALISGAAGLAALILYAANVTGPLGMGGMEWLIIGPILLWMLVVGTRLVRRT
jgi:hypothetical membrane protein